MIGELTDDLILSGDEVENLFVDEDTQVTPPDNEKGDTETEKEKTAEEVISTDDLFENPESVGSEEDNQEKEQEDAVEDKGSTSPNFYSSIAKALLDDSILPDLDEETINSIKTPEDFSDAIEKQIQARLDERQRRIDAALNAEVEPDDVRKYENTLSYLDSIKEEALKDESDNGEKLRSQLIYQDFINRGYSKERAQREVKKSFDAGTDIEDAKEALEGNKEFFNNQYQSLIEDARKQAEQEQKELRKQASELKKSLLEDKEVFEGITLDKVTRQRAYEAATKPIARTEDGEYLTAIQKYESDNPVEFRKKLAVLFTMTDGFKNIDKLVKGKVKKEVKSSLRELEHTIKSTSRATGNPEFVSGVREDSESYIGQGWLPDDKMYI